MKGDFTRDTFDPAKHFSRVLLQQGRVTLDADANEQTAILLRYLRALARDLIGPYAAPAIGGGFDLFADDQGVFRISQGSYYVDGILVENEGDCLYAAPAGSAVPAQPDLPAPLPGANDLLAALKQSANQAVIVWIYLDVWERHLTFLDDAAIRETALGGPDTCTRAKVVWQVKVLDVQRILQKLQDEYDRVEQQVKVEPDSQIQSRLRQQMENLSMRQRQLEHGLQQVLEMQTLDGLPCAAPLLACWPVGPARLTARVDPGHLAEGPCVTPPASKYRGAENQLYRIEIHQGGQVGDKEPPTFKWSRDNGSVVTAWLGSRGQDLQVACARNFAAGQWVELSDDRQELQGQPGMLVRLAKVEGDVLSVDPATPAPAWSEQMVRPKVRRWDHAQTATTKLVNGAIPIQESGRMIRPFTRELNVADMKAADIAGTRDIGKYPFGREEIWLDLEDGVQIQFDQNGRYVTGDYWLIPARVADGQVEWPEGQFLPPRGIKHHYAPLGFIWWNVKSGAIEIQSCRCQFHGLSDCLPANARKYDVTPVEKPVVNADVSPVTPVTPIVTPVAPVVTPIKPVIAPVNPVVAPVAPIVTPPKPAPPSAPNP